LGDRRCNLEQFTIKGDGILTDPKPEPWRIYVTVIIGLLWMFYIGFWLFYYASSYGILQNIASIIISLAIVGAVILAIWLPWSMKNME